MNRKAFPGQGALINPQLPDPEEAQISRDLVARLQKNDIPRYQILGRDLLPPAFSLHRGATHHGPGQGVDGLERLGFLDEADDRIDQDDPDNDSGFHPFL